MGGKDHMKAVQLKTLLQSNHVYRSMNFKYVPMKSSFFSLLLLISFVLPTHVQARQNNLVNLKVQLAPERVKEGDKVALRGSSEELGQWSNTNVWLTQSSELGMWVGEVKLKENAKSSPITFKYIIERADGSVEWESGANRILVSTKEKAKKTNVDVDFFDRVPVDALNKKVKKIQISINLTQFYLSTGELDEVRLMADIPGVGFLADQGEGLLLSESKKNSDIWEATLTLPIGSRKDFSFKLYFSANGEVRWESIPGHANHVAVMESNSDEITLAMQYDGEQGRFVPMNNLTKGVVVDDFAPIKALYANEYKFTEHAYMEVLSLFALGQEERAWEGYKKWRQSNPEGREIDDMVMLYADYIATTSGLEQAQRLLDSEALKEKNEYRKVQFAYHKGELLQRLGKNKEAKEILNSILKTYTPSINKTLLKKAKTPQERRALIEEQQKTPLQPLLDYAKQGLVWAYLSDTSPDSIKLGHAWAKSLTNASQERTRKNALKQYIRLMQQEGETGLVRESYIKLVKESTEKQKKHVRFEWLAYEVEQGHTKQAAAIWDSLSMDLGMNFTHLSELNSPSNDSLATRKPVQVRASQNTPDKTTLRLQNRMVLKRAQVLQQMDWADQAELIEQLVEDNSLNPVEKAQRQELRKAIKERKLELKKQQNAKG